MQETWVRSLDSEDPLEQEMATHSCILAWEIPWTEEPGRLQSMGLQKSWTQLTQQHQCIRQERLRLLCPWDYPGKNTGVDYHFLLQGIFLTQGLNPCLLHWQADSLPLCYLGSPYTVLGAYY